MLPYALGKIADPLIAHLPAECAVHLAETDYIKGDRCAWMVEGVWIFRTKPLEMIPLLEPCQQIDSIGGFRQDEQIADDSALPLPEAGIIAPQRQSCDRMHLKLKVQLVFFANHIWQGDHLEKLRDRHAVVEFPVAKHVLNFFVVHDELIGIVKQHDALVDILEDRHGKRFEHIVPSILKRRPVHQIQPQAVPHDRMVDHHERAVPLREQKHGVNKDNKQNRRHVQDIWHPVMVRSPVCFFDQYVNRKRYQKICENQMHDIQRLHLIGEKRHRTIPAHIVHRDLPEDIYQHDRRVEQGVYDRDLSEQAGFSDRLALGKAIDKVNQRNEHPVDSAEIDTGRNRHIEIFFRLDAEHVG